jgi:hypothetical protein
VGVEKVELSILFAVSEGITQAGEFDLVLI